MPVPWKIREWIGFPINRRLVSNPHRREEERTRVYIQFTWYNVRAQCPLQSCLASAFQDCLLINSPRVKCPVYQCVVLFKILYIVFVGTPNYTIVVCSRSQDIVLFPPPTRRQRQLSLAPRLDDQIVLFFPHLKKLVLIKSLANFFSKQKAFTSYIYL